MLPSEEVLWNQSSFPAFINKLWKIVNDPATNDMIMWSMKGTSFFIMDQLRFTVELIPKYFKHSNWASFVRQLNMYGFKKISSIDSGSLSMTQEEVEFYHSLFVKGKHELLSDIKRKPQLGTRVVPSDNSQQNLEKLLSNVESLRTNQEMMSSKFQTMKSENELLWKEYATMRLKFSKQQQIIEKLVHFLVAMVKNSPGGNPLTPKRKFHHLALEGIDRIASSSEGKPSNEFEPGGYRSMGGPVIREVTELSPGPSPVYRPGKIIHYPNSVSPTVSDSTHSPTFVVVGGKGGGAKDSSKIFCKIEPMDVRESSGSPSVSTTNLYQIEEFLNKDYSDTANSDLAGSGAILVEDSVTHGNMNKESHSPPYDVIISSSDLDPDLDPNLLTPVDLAVVNPNVVAAVNRNVVESKPNFAVTNSNLVDPNVIVSYNLPAATPSMAVDAANTNTLTASKSIFTSPPTSNKGKNPGKLQGGGKRVPQSTGRRGGKLGGSEPLYRSPPPQYQEATAPAAISDLVLHNKHMEKDDFVDQVDEVQYSLDSIKDFISNNNLNIDASALLSMFNSEDDSTLLDHWNLDNQEISGNELSLYNPSLYDINDDDSITGFEEPSPLKKPADGVPKGHGSLGVAALQNNTDGVSKNSGGLETTDGGSKNGGVLRVSPPRGKRLRLKLKTPPQGHFDQDEDELTTPCPSVQNM